MGCDIHIVLERKDKKRDRWVGVRSYRYFKASLLANIKTESVMGLAGFVIKQRHYDFFNDLCGVRGDGSEFGYQSKGLPDDASDLTLMELSEDNPDLHSHSWLSMAELRPVMEKHYGPQIIASRLKGERVRQDVLRMFVDDEIGEDYTPEEDWRLMFAFDN
jgi:hypothetical protein